MRRLQSAICVALTAVAVSSCSGVEQSPDELSDFATSTTAATPGPYEQYVAMAEQAGEPFVGFADAEARAAELCQQDPEGPEGWPVPDQLLARAYCPELLSPG